MRCLLLVLEAPLMSFGREMVDARGPVADFPAASMLTGLLANALGWRREQREDHATLQHRLHFAVRLDRGGQRFTDFQTAQLAKNDAGWTTRGRSEGREGDSYSSPHIRLRDFAADACAAVALALAPPAEGPTADELAAALRHPARPLFLGRKPCLPSRPVLHGVDDYDNLLEALSAIPAADDAGAAPLAQLPDDSPGRPGDELRSIIDERNWISGVHGGLRTVRVRRLGSGSA
jgi:CRISPR system Cascade subunit CasD